MDTGVLVHMRLGATVPSLLVKPVQAYGKYMDDRGCIVVQTKVSLGIDVKFVVLSIVLHPIRKLIL